MTVWYLARGTGLAALILLTISTVLGALVSEHARPGVRYVVQFLHRTTAVLGISALAIHVAAILADSFAHVGWLGALVPFASGYLPVAVALGTVGAYLIVGAALLGLVRGRMAASPFGARMWRVLHGLAYVGWMAAMMHGVTAGTDAASTGWVKLIYAGSLTAVVAAVFYRIAGLRGPDGSGDRLAGLGPRGPRALTGPSEAQVVPATQVAPTQVLPAGQAVTR